MGPGGRREACKLTASRETRLGGDAASRDVQLRAATPGRRLGRRGVAGCRGEEARHAPERAGPRLLQTSMRQGAAGPRGRWRACWGGFGAGAAGVVACDRAFFGPGGLVCDERSARAGVCVCVHTPRAPGAYLYL